MFLKRFRLYLLGEDDCFFNVYLHFRRVCGISATVCLQIIFEKLFCFDGSHLFSRYWTGLKRIFCGISLVLFALLTRTQVYKVTVILLRIPVRSLFLWKFFFSRIFFLVIHFAHFFCWCLHATFLGILYGFAAMSDKRVGGGTQTDVMTGSICVS